MKGLTGRSAPFEQEKTCSIPSSFVHQRYLLLYGNDEQDMSAKKILEQIQMALLYAKLPYDQLTFLQWNEAKIALKPYVQGAIILIGERQEHLQHASHIKNYVNELGGLVVNTLRSSDCPLNEFMGIIGRPNYAKGVRGLCWRARIYPGLSEQVVGESKVSSSSLQVQLDADTRVWAESTQPEDAPVPLLWTMRRGKGNILYWNSTIIQSKEWRGAFIQTLLKAQDIGVKVTIGAFVVYLDDFPSPVWKQTSSNNKTGMPDREYRTKFWDPDMQALAAKYGLRYSSGCILSYNDRVNPPFEPFLYDEEGHSELYPMEAEIARQLGEVGLHGYNHNPLNLTYTEEQRSALGYEPWPSMDAMRESLQTTRKLWQDYLKLPMPTFYIPASNVLSNEGKQVLLEVFPELRTISSSSDESEKHAVFKQEYLPDPDAPQIMGTPRMTYGYTTSSHRKFDLYSGIGMIGIISHFIHPDDVFSASRSSGKKWGQLLDEFDRYLSEIIERFPWLQAMTATQLAEALRYFHAAEVRIDRSEKGHLTVYATPLASPIYLELHVQDPEIWRVSHGGEIIARDAEYKMLCVMATEPKLVLKYGQ
jgi:hypothetical protein